MRAGTFSVTNLNNTGAGSLRQAITDANAAGAGGHLIDFTVSGVITITSHLPVITNNHITIDGAGQTIVVSANGGDIARYVFRGNAGADFLTIKNLDIKNTGYEAFRFDGSPTNITIENIRWYNESGNYYNYGIFFVGNAINLTVRDVIAENHQNYGAVLEITGTATNLLIDNLTFDNILGDQRSQVVVRVAGVASNITIKNCNWNLDSGVSTDDSDYGMLFASNVSNLTVTDVNILNCEVYPIYIAGSSDQVKINRFTSTNGPGYGGAFGMRFQGAASNFDLDTISLDLDHTTSTDDGNYGIYFGSTTTNINIDSLIIHDAEVYGIYFGGVASGDTIRRATIDNFDGGTTQQGIHFQGGANNILIEDVVLNGDVTGTTNNGDYGLWFNSDATSDITLTNLSITNYNVDGVWFYEVDNLNISHSEFSNCQDGIEFHNNDDRANNVITNSIFDNNSRSGIIINVANATSEFNLDSNVFSNNTNYGVWLYSSGGLKNIQITNNTIFGNGTSGIYNERADGVLYSSNSIYNNPIGIDNYATDGNNGLINPGKVPALSASVDVGSDNFDVSFTLPTICNTADCDVEFFTNNVGDPKYNGRTYRSTALGLGSGLNTVTVNSGGNTSGTWSATLKVSSLNNSVSEFSSSIGIKPQFPANVGTSIALWLRADQGIDSNAGVLTWGDLSGNGRDYSQATAARQAALNPGDIRMNFNAAFDFDADEFSEANFWNALDDGTIYVIANGENHSGWRALYDVERDDFTLYNRSGADDVGFWQYGSSPTNIGNSNILPLVNYTHMYGGAWTNVTTDGLSIISNGDKQLTTMEMTNTISSSGVTFIGSGNARYWWDGLISEVIIYKRELSPIEHEQVESYLALRYGITLDQTIASTNYVSSSNSIIWSAGSGYDNDIAGIGRDDDGAFLQKQSKSINHDAVVTIFNENQSAGFPVSNDNNTSLLNIDNSYLLWGNNDSTASFSEVFTPTTFTPPPPTVFYHMKRTWKVAETNTINDVTISIPAIVGAEYMLVHNSADFNTGTPIEIELTSDGNGNYYAVYDFTDGQYFTFGANRNAPGCVPAGLAAWWRADKMADVNEWKDFSQNDWNAVKAGTSVVMDSSGANFNPTFQLSGGYFDYSSNSDRIFNSPANLDNAYVFWVGQPISGQHLSGFSEQTTNGNSLSTFHYSNNNFYLDAPYGYRLNTGTIVPDGGVYGVSNIFGGKRTPTTFTNFIQGKDIGSISGAYSSFSANPVGRATIGRENTTASSGGSGLTEVIVYRDASGMTAVDELKINSYLAIKYGITLDQTVPTSYLSGGADSIWIAGNGYDNDIAGISRDDCQALHQKQSKSINPDAIVTIYNGNQSGVLPVSNQANLSLLSADKSFLVWGNNDAAIAYTVPYPSNSFVTLMSRTWKVKETGTVGVVTILASEPNADVLLVDADGDFTDGNTIEVALENGQITYDFSDGDYFTFGTLECKEVNTIACATTIALDLTAYVSNYTVGGYWSETTSS